MEIDDNKETSLSVLCLNREHGLFKSVIAKSNSRSLQNKITAKSGSAFFVAEERALGVKKSCRWQVFSEQVRSRGLLLARKWSETERSGPLGV